MAFLIIVFVIIKIVGQSHLLDVSPTEIILRDFLVADPAHRLSIHILSRLILFLGYK